MPERTILQETLGDDLYAKLENKKRLRACCEGKGRVLIVAGSDSGGGAGIQADIKTVTVLGGYATTAVTALTAQNTLGVHSVFPVPPEFVQQQMKVVLDDIGADCIKIGMLHRVPLIEAVVETLQSSSREICTVVDPVMIAKGGSRLLEDDALHSLKEKLLPLTDILTPNAPEAEALSGLPVNTLADQETVAKALSALGPKIVVVKGGHVNVDAPFVVDVLYDSTTDTILHFQTPRIMTSHTHGTGCTFASAIATGISQGMIVEEAVIRACDFVHGAIVNAPGFGKGHGPLAHGYNLSKESRRPPSYTKLCTVVSCDMSRDLNLV
mmetsp:Transcript_5348/g.8296  ORF Transcript_5348/g.8296 Transcript_5348/m.8296 type:complete len:325 (-) Transcript_5348:229-1203(-)